MKLLGKTVNIDFKTLKKISDSNFGKLNRSIDCDAVQKKLNISESTSVSVKPLIIHEYAFFSQTTPHYRCIVNINGIEGIQDIYFKQLDNL